MSLLLCRHPPICHSANADAVFQVGLYVSHGEAPTKIAFQGTGSGDVVDAVEGKGGLQLDSTFLFQVLTCPLQLLQRGVGPQAPCQP